LLKLKEEKSKLESKERELLAFSKLIDK
jgi:hypothetical protein